MTIQWTLVAAFLYCELAFIILLLLPFISPNVWHYLFESRLYSIREMHKYSTGLSEQHSHLDSEIQLHMKLFRSQRNFYIAGFALFLWFIIRRLVMLISTQASLNAENETAIKRAQNATETAQKLLKQNEEVAKVIEVGNKRYVEEITSLQEKLFATENALETTKSNIYDVKSRAEGVSKDYAELLENHSKLQGKQD